MEINDSWALVTGAAGGIGAALCYQLAAKGAHLILVDSDRARVDELARELKAQGAMVQSYGVDITDKDAMQQFYEWTVHERFPIDLVVNSAGILEVGTLEQTDLKTWERILDVNVLGVVITNQLFLPGLREKGRGFVVNLASASGRIGLPALTAYSTSKFALMGLSQAMDAEYRPQGVGVCAICPGIVKTNIASRGQLSEAQEAQALDLMAQRGCEPELVAQEIIRAIEDEKRVVYVGNDAQALHWASRVVPTRASGLIARFMG